MKTKYSPIPLVVTIFCLCAFIECKDKVAIVPDTDYTAQFLAANFGLEQERLVFEEVEMKAEAEQKEEEKEVEKAELKRKRPQPITDIFLLYNRPGYSAIWKDLNKGTKGDDIILCYTKDPNKGKPITALKVRFDRYRPRNHEDINCNNAKPCDVNKDAGGKDVFVYLSRNPAEGKPITNVDVLFGRPFAKRGWGMIHRDLNEKARGEDIWLAYHR